MGGGGVCFDIGMGNSTIEKPKKNWFQNLFAGNTYGVFESENGNAEHAQRIAEELAKKRKVMRIESRKLENQIIKYVNASLDSLLKDIESINEIKYGNISLRLNMKAIIKKNDALKENVIGCISDKIDDRLVLTDIELSEIMAERDSIKRTEKLDDFCNKLQKEALISFQGKIKKAMKQQMWLIRREIEGRIRDVENSLDESVKIYTNLLENQEDHIIMKKNKSEYMFQQGICDCFLEILSDDFINEDGRR